MLGACGSPADSAEPELETAGDTGGSTAAGGSRATGGSRADAGTTGGAIGAGGTVSTGGAVGAGGTPSSGGSVATGGAAGAPPPATGTPGVWENVTPAGLALGWDAAAGGVAHHVLVDPARPTDAYALTSDNQGVWKSTDYGAAWTRVDTSPQLKGSQRASAIDSNRSRDPSTPPTLWTVNYGDGDNVWKSTDGGVSWRKIALPAVAEFSPYDRDPYSFAVDPYDGTHLLMGFHGTRELAESTDAGETWTVITTPSGFGSSVYPFFIDTGSSSTTRKTWLTQAMWRTTDGGASWTQVSTLEHVHGNGQIFDAGSGVIYAAGVGGPEGHGIYRSADYGATWKRVNDGTIQNGLYASATYIYADYGWATGGGQSQKLQRAPRNPGTSWSNYAATPSGMVNGSNHAAVAFDGTHYILITGNWTAGIWRYVEP
jgi:photosystem II stability/assembly factor-like uncharacterized protein